jgi:chromosome segregation and condensation protein ScpB
VPPSLPDPEITARIEAALYAAGRPLSINDLMRAAGINKENAECFDCSGDSTTR